MYVDIHIKQPLFFSDFNETLFFQHIFKNPRMLNYIKILQVGVELFNAEGRTDRHDKGNSLFFQNFAKAPKNCTSNLFLQMDRKLILSIFN
jgi:hypothetical protein